MVSKKQSVSVIFVCMGNICRSPTGEGVFQYFVEDSGFGEVINIDSAGTISYHTGDPADHRMRQAASKRGYSLDSIARQVQKADIDNFDLVVAMDRDNLIDLENLAGGSKSHIRLLGSFLDGVENNESAPSVPDPYYGGGQGFEEVLDIIEAACPRMLQYCQELLGNK